MLNDRQARRKAGGSPAKPLFKVALLICLALLPLGAFGHPDLDLQIADLDTQIQSEPASAVLYLKRGDLYRRHQDLQSAARDFATARRLEPDQPLLDFYEGRLYLDSGDGTAAETHLARYLSLDKGNAMAWVLRGQANIQLQQAEKAADCFAEAITNSEHPSPELYRLQILATLASGESRWESAAQIADNGVQRFGIEVTVLGLAIDIALATSQAEKAAAYLDMLPPRLLELPQWSERASRLACYDNQPSAVSDVCLSRASQIVHDLANTFMPASGVTGGR